MYDADGLRERYIRLGTEGRAESYRLIAHELVRWHVGQTWGLPLVIEEGLAELVSAVFLPRGDEILAEHRQTVLHGRQSDAPILRDKRGGLQMLRASWPLLSPQEKCQPCDSGPCTC
ncbi:MAG: hypothetical protein ACI841_003321 [Planctomycetota bacterium]